MPKRLRLAGGLWPPSPEEKAPEEQGGAHFENCCFISVAILCRSSDDRLLPDGKHKPPHLTDKN